MIQYFTPYSLEKNLGKAYNEAVNLLPNDEDWACLLDGDTSFLCPNYGVQIAAIIKKYENNSEIGLFTCVTNRTNNPYQRLNGVLSENADMKHHLELAKEIQKEYYDNIIEIPRTISGHLMLFKKKVWASVGGFDEGGILKVDNKFSRKILLSNRKIYLMRGVYIFHVYRLLTGKKDKSHLL